MARKLCSLFLAGLALPLTLSACDKLPGAAAKQVTGGGNQPTDTRSGAAQTQTIVDRNGFEQPMPAVDVPVPSGWKFEGAVRWDNVNGQCSLGIASPMFRLTSPDGKASIEVLPGFIVTTNDQDIRRRGSTPGDFCVVGMSDSGENFARRVAIPFLRPQARVRSIVEIPLDPSIESLLRRFAQAGPAGGMRINGYMLQVLIDNPDGTVERITLGGVISAGEQMLPGVPPLVLNQNMIAYAVRAPADQLAATERLAAQVRAGVRLRPDWDRRVSEMRNRVTKPVFPKPSSRRGGGSGGSGGPDWIDETGRRWHDDQRRGDIEQEKRVDSIREEERCVLSDGTVVTVSIHTGCPSQ